MLGSMGLFTVSCERCVGACVSVVDGIYRLLEPRSGGARLRLASWGVGEERRLISWVVEGLAQDGARLSSEGSGTAGWSRVARVITRGSALITNCVETDCESWWSDHSVVGGTSWPRTDLCLTRAGVRPPGGPVLLYKGEPVDLGLTVVCPRRV